MSRLAKRCNLFLVYVFNVVGVAHVAKIQFVAGKCISWWRLQVFQEYISV